MLLAGWLLIAVAGTGPAVPAPAAVAISPGRTTTLIASDDVGAPLERAFPNPAYLRAAAADAEGRWDDARILYRQAADAWAAIDHTRPSRALDLAVAKAEHEAMASQALAFRTRNPSGISGHLPEEARRTYRRRQAVEDARLLRDKLMATRTARGQVAPLLYARTRARLEDARDNAEPGGSGDAEIALLMCATEAVGGDLAAAGADRARALPRQDAAEEDPDETVAAAACAAALGRSDAALTALERFVLGSPLPRADATLRELYLANDWDHLRGTPRFETLFR
ncbi:MAG TPA: hypothetical protein VHG72_17460 [Polyangia bacterium]|nr:hypothetical protein [Polyangia bacterium]